MMKKKRDIQFVYFDIGGVLMHWKDILHSIVKKTGKPYEEVHAAFSIYDIRSCRGEMHPDVWGPLLGKDLGLKSSETLDIVKLSKETFRPIKETHSFLREVSKTHSVGLLTNIHLGTYDMFWNEGYIPHHHYHAVVKSCEIGLVKPQPEIYLHAQKRAKKKPEEILFIDDLLQNVEGAKRVGWNSIVFDTQNPSKSIEEIRKYLYQ
ncbi:HAD-IA family hydrolase [Candidatus Gottesmanbacteria bacterium]|nr:HAD-IA family hydrolase [Candidatus Gottesmanbacteria bacterium]